MIEIGSLNKTGPMGPDGLDGEPGATWHSGDGVPGADEGLENDLHLDIGKGDVYKKLSGKWVLILNLIGPRGLKGKQGEQGDPGKPGKNGRITMLQSSGGSSMTKGKIVPTYNEVTVVAAAQTVVATYTIPATKAFDVIEIKVNGGNVADWFVKIDGAIITKTSTYFEEFDDTIKLYRKQIDAGQVISVEAKNLGTTDELFNATIIGDLYGVS